MALTLCRMSADCWTIRGICFFKTGVFLATSCRPERSIPASFAACAIICCSCFCLWICNARLPELLEEPPSLLELDELEEELEDSLLLLFCLLLIIRRVYVEDRLKGLIAGFTL